MIALLLRLYPRRYRRENGAEILAVHQEAAAHLTRLGRVRDTATSPRTRCGCASD